MRNFERLIVMHRFKLRSLIAAASKGFLVGILLRGAKQYASLGMTFNKPYLLNDMSIDFSISPRASFRVRRNSSEKQCDDEESLWSNNKDDLLLI